MLRSDPSILVLWNQTLVLTTIMSPAHNEVRAVTSQVPGVSLPGYTVVVRSPWHRHLHSGGGRSSQVFTPATCACHEDMSTLSMCTCAPGPGVPINIHGFFGGVESGCRKGGRSYREWSLAATASWQTAQPTYQSRAVSASILKTARSEGRCLVL